MRTHVLVEIDGTEFFVRNDHITVKCLDENVNYRYCSQYFPEFSDSAKYQFIFSLEDSKHYAKVLCNMQSYGCSNEFIDAYAEAYQTGAHFVLFYIDPNWV